MRARFLNWCSLVIACFTAHNVFVSGQNCSGPPTDYEHAELAQQSQNLSEWPHGTSVEYECVDGYVRQGRRHITCTGGVWSKRLFRCERVKCSRLRAPENGFSADINNLPGQSTEFRCNAGYKIIGRSLLTCYTDGAWRPSAPPRCSLTICPDTRYLSHGSKFQDTFSMMMNQYGIEEHYTCDHGHKLVGPRYRECMASGQWSRTEPTCEEETCEPLDPIYNGVFFIPGSTGPGDVVHFVCDEGADMEYSNVFMTECKKDLTWTHPTNQCLKRAVATILKDGLRHYKDGYRWKPVTERTDALQFDTAVRSICIERFELISENGRYLDRTSFTTYNRNGTWIPSLPFCKPARCDIKTSQRTMITNETEHTLTGKVEHGTAVLFTCENGYRFQEGDVIIRRSCDKGNLNQPENCQPKNCIVPAVENGRMDYVGQRYRQLGKYALHRYQVYVTCSKKFELIRGQTYLNTFQTTCQLGNFTHHPLASCVEARCDINPSNTMLVTVDNERFEGPKVEHGTRVMFSCINGYEFTESTDRSISVSCSKGELKHPTCRPKNCIVPAVENGRMDYVGQHYGRLGEYALHRSQVSVTCSQGYELIRGETYRNTFHTTCQLGNFTQPPLASCVEARCDINPPDTLLVTVDHGRFNGPKVEHGTLVMFSCRNGYEFTDSTDGSISASCSKGELNQPTCRPRNCNAPAVENGRMHYGNNNTVGNYANHGFTVTVNCSQGYELIRRHTYLKRFQTTCKLGNFTDHPLASCVEERCSLAEWGNTIIRIPGQRNLSAEVVVLPNTSVEFSCPFGYDFSSNSGTAQEAICRHGLLVIPRCVKTSCGIPRVSDGSISTIGMMPEIKNGTVVNGTKVEVRCSNHYELKAASGYIDSFEATCKEGDWSDKIFPNCVGERCFINSIQIPNIAPFEKRVFEDREWINISCIEEFEFKKRSLAPKKTIARMCKKGKVKYPVCIEERCRTWKVVNGKLHKASGSKTWFQYDMAQHGVELEVKCDEDYNLTLAGQPLDRFTATCDYGVWNNSIELPKCIIGNCTVPQSKMQYTSSRTALNGEDIVVFCPFDVYEYDYTEEENITCIDGQFEGSWPSCKEKDTSCSNLQNGTVLYKHSRPIVTCDEGFSLHVTEQTIECIDGALKANKDREVECFPDDCLVPANHEGRRIFQGSKKSEILEEQKVDHQKWVNISCSEPETEPAYRQFICVAGKWKLDGRTVWDTTKENDTFPECRAAVCSVSCKNKGVCIRDNVCDCPAGTHLPNCDADPCYIENVPNMQSVIGSSQDVVNGPVNDGTIVLFSCMNGYSFDSEEEHIRRICSRGQIHIPECKVKCPKPDRKNYVPKISAYYPGNTIEAICCTDANKCEVSRDECLMDGSWRIGGSCREDCFQVTRNKLPRWSQIERKFKHYGDTNSIISCFIASLANDECKSVSFRPATKECICIYATLNNSNFFRTEKQKNYQTAFC